MTVNSIEIQQFSVTGTVKRSEEFPCQNKKKPNCVACGADSLLTSETKHFSMSARVLEEFSNSSLFRPGLHHRHPVCVVAKPRQHERMSDAGISARKIDWEEAKTRSGQGLQHHLASHPRQGTFHDYRVQKPETTDNMNLLSAAAEKLRKKRHKFKQSPWNILASSEQKALPHRIVTSRPLTEPRRLKGACARTVQSCTLRKNGATPQMAERSPLEPNPLLCSAAWARPSKEMKIDV